jgi:hypothetical protein
MTRIPSAVALLLLAAAPLAAQPSTNDRAAAVGALRDFVNRNGTAPIDDGRVRGTYTVEIKGVSGCELRIADVSALTIVRHQFEVSLDLAKLSPDPEVLRSGSAPANRDVRAYTTSGDSAVAFVRVLGMLGQESRLPPSKGREYAFTFRDAATAGEARRLLARAITACGGRPASLALRARIVADRLYKAGNDPATFRLKQVCRRRIVALAGAGASLPSDSTFQTSRYERSLHFSATVTAGGQARPFVCSFDKVGEQFELDEAKLYSPRTDP